jgi:hypothetical protein
MDRADHRLTQLRDLLHNAGAPPMTAEGEDGVVMKAHSRAKAPKLVRVAKGSKFLFKTMRRNYHNGLPLKRELLLWRSYGPLRTCNNHHRTPLQNNFHKP